MKKISEALFSGLSERGKLKYFNYEDLEKFCLENDGENIIIQLNVEAKASEKLKMYAYYYGPLLECAMIGYTLMGWQGVDKVVADYKLRAEFAKDFVKNPKGEYEPYLIRTSKMTKIRLYKFIEDCLLFIESDLKQNIPDSEAYKASKGTDHKFKSV